ncbi:mannonate dehydratase [Primorskyibacter flagellatus]|uniref:mannonate dehydratase n=1 Tax=Primorskyibacter flagellatus TaxID=1387277 RepID=UPI0022873D45|nr:mannonate dehydratase [Primorskyibacter flagellatus]
MRDGSASGLEWDVVESLLVSEGIKRQAGNRKHHIETYKESQTNLHAASIDVVCYNFMPVLDWTRSVLAYRLPSGTTCKRFNLIDFAVLDIHILRRRSDAVISRRRGEVAAKRFPDMSPDRRRKLAGNVVSGMPGTAETLSLEAVRVHLSAYDGVSSERLRANMVVFVRPRAACAIPWPVPLLSPGRPTLPLCFRLCDVDAVLPVRTR